jgi:hypothetical protein
MTIISDPTLALQTITDVAKRRDPGRMSLHVGVGNDIVFNGQGCSPSEVVDMLARATSCSSVTDYSEYGNKFNVADLASRGMGPSVLWAVPATMPGTGRSVVVLVGITDWPATDSVNIEGIADPS